MSTSKAGQSTLPSRWVSFSGLRATQNAAAKNTAVYPSCTAQPSAGSSGSSMAKEVLAVRGMARQGPMER